MKNLDTGKTIVVKVNDRGPFHEGRIIDLSYAAANKLGIVKKGTGRVEVSSISFENGVNDNVFVQVGAYQDRENADNVKLKLAAADIQSDIKSVIINARRSIYRVRIGPFDAKEMANKLVQDLHAMGLEEARVFTNNEF